MSSLVRLNANTPFLQGIPNSLVAKEWYRFFASVSQIIGGGSILIQLDDFQVEFQTEKRPLDSASIYYALLERLSVVELQANRFNAAMQNNLEARDSDIECLLLARRPTPINNTLTLFSNANFIDAEVPAGTIDGANATFTLANTPISGSVHLYLNGLRMRPTTDFSVAGSTITYAAGAKPQSGDNHVADYRH